MCGICGYVDPTLAGSADEATLARMVSTLRHRGPDDEGCWMEPAAGVGLANRRLAIVDRSIEGHQPMHSASGRYVLTMNGEIYNHRQLRADLLSAGQLRGHSDTEVLLAMIDERGVGGALERAVGQFAIALWDRLEQVLHLVRDRLGEKPLYYGRAGPSGLAFGSELRALRAHPLWEAAIDRGAVALLMRHGYIPAPYSIYRGVYKIEPGTIATIRASDPWAGRGPDHPLKANPYWSVDQAVIAGHRAPFKDTERDAVDELEALIQRAVAEQVQADVPVGALLSGGVDSSMIVALMQRTSSAPVRTFTIGFREHGFDEAPFARRVAAHLGTEHTELYISADIARAVIPRLPVIYDEPFSDSSQIPTFLVAQLARQDVTVALSGDGGDELFLGYDRYRTGPALFDRAATLPRPLRRATSRALKTVSVGRWDAALRRLRPWTPARIRPRIYGEKVHKLGDILAADTLSVAHRDLLSHWRDPTAMVADSTEPPTVFDTPAAMAFGVASAEEMARVDQRSFLPDQLLVKVDRATMAVALETRLPLLDHRIVEFSWRLPMSMKIRAGERKWALRRILVRHVPAQLFDRPKSGFTAPIDDWLRDPLRAWAEDLLDSNAIRRQSFFEPSVVRRVWLSHLRGDTNAHYRLWNVLMFQAWLNEWHPTL